MTTPTLSPTRLLNRLAPYLGWALALLLIATSLVWIALDWWNQPPPVVPHHDVQTAVSNWELAWALDDVTLDLPPVVGETDAGPVLVFVGRWGEMEEAALTAVDAHDGSKLWQLDQQTLTRPNLWPEELAWSPVLTWRWSGLAAANGAAYAVEAYFLETAVNAYDLATGDRLWHHKLGVLNGSDAAYTWLADQRLGVRISEVDFNAFYLLDPARGFMKERRQGDAALVFWMDEEPYRIYEASADTVNVSQHDSWRRTLGGCGLGPHVLGPVLLVKAYRCEPGAAQAHTAQLYALDRQTGAVRWQYAPGVASNLALVGERVYFLTTSGDLLAVEGVSGVVETVVSFTPDMLAFLPEEEEGGAATAVSFYVAAGEEVLAVYFGDSGQLLVFHRQ